ncbi:MAG: hypothetical protein JSW28_07590, partial [Thermoplasmata archaeon]
PGVHDISFSVMDEDEVWSDPALYSLRINQIPKAHLTPPFPSMTNEGTSLAFQGYGTDDGFIVAYNWSSDINGGLSGDANFVTSGLSVGIHEISFAVMDNDGAWSEEVSFFVKVNQIPKAYMDPIAPNPANKGDMISFSGRGTDDGEVRGYEWTSSIDDLLSSQASFSTSQISVGDHTIRFRVKDDNGVWSDYVESGLQVNRIPTAHIDSITPNNPNENDAIYFEGHGSDDGVIEAYLWRSNIDGELSQDPEFEALLSVGVHTIYLSVMDDMSVWSTEAVKKIGVNGIPKAYIDDISPNPVKEGEVVNLVGHGEDDGDIIAYEWTSSIGGTIGSERTLSISSLSIGTHAIYFRVEDNKGVWSDSVSGSITVELRINQVPAISLISPKNGDIIIDSVVIEVLASDADGSINRIEFRLDDNDWVRISDSSEAYYSLDVSDISEGEHVIYVRAFDGEEYSVEEYVIVYVEPDEGGGILSGESGIFFVAILAVFIIIVVCIILLWSMAGRGSSRREWR